MEAVVEESAATLSSARVSGPVQREAVPFPAVASQTVGYASAATLTEGALAKAPEPAAATAGEMRVEHVREAIVAALATAAIPLICSLYIDTVIGIS